MVLFDSLLAELAICMELAVAAAGRQGATQARRRLRRRHRAAARAAPRRPPPGFRPSEADAELAQKLGQLQQLIAVSPHGRVGQPVSFHLSTDTLRRLLARMASNSPPHVSPAHGPAASILNKQSSCCFKAACLIY